jgi:hypothetical protein
MVYYKWLQKADAFCVYWNSKPFERVSRLRLKSQRDPAKAQAKAGGRKARGP